MKRKFEAGQEVIVTDADSGYYGTTGIVRRYYDDGRIHIDTTSERAGTYSWPKGTGLTFIEIELELFDKRIEGEEIDPELVKVGDEIQTTFHSGDLNKTYSGVVAKRQEQSNNHTAFLTEEGLAIFTSYWATDKLILVKKAPEKHPLKDVPVGTKFSIVLDGFGEDVHFVYTKHTPKDVGGQWLEERTHKITGVVEWVNVRDDYRAVEAFDKYKGKLIK